jgi:hypothetical protein
VVLTLGQWALKPSALAGPFDVTPTLWVYLPNVMRMPSATPTASATVTPTPTATPTATPTHTTTPTPTLPAALPMVGDVRREDPNKPSYATYIEDIWHWSWIRNDNGRSVYFGILGVNVVNTTLGGSYQFFHTSWDGAGAPSGALELYGNGCYGPNGIPCAGRWEDGQHRDAVRVNEPGNYTMSLAICQSNFWACQQPGGAWQVLDSVTFVAVHWTPQAPGPTTTPEPCRLITTDPRGVYLKCR